MEIFCGSSFWIAGSLTAFFLSVTKEETGLNATILEKKEKPNLSASEIDHRNNADVLFLNILLAED